MRSRCGGLVRRGKHLALVVMMVAVTGCAEDPPSPSAEKAPAPTPAKVFDPPQSFDAKAGTLLPAGILPNLVSLHGNTGYAITANDLQAVDLATGRSLGRAAPENEIFEAAATLDNLDTTHAPTITNLNGTDLVLAAFTVQIPGEGTTPTRFGVELTGMDAGTNKQAWSLLVELPVPVTGSRRSNPDVTLVGVVDRLLVFTAITTESYYTYGIDLLTPKVAWKVDGLAAGALAGDVVVGITETRSRQSVVGHKAADGSRVWNQDDMYDVVVAQAGPRFAFVYSRNYRDGVRSSRVIDSAGAAVAPIDTYDGGSVRCSYDAALTVTCFRHEPDPFVFAFDSQTGQVLWELRDGGDRLVPQVTVAWHGAVYGGTDNGPVVLDARTGLDRSASVGITPLAVNERCGVAGTRQDGVRCYPANG